MAKNVQIVTPVVTFVYPHLTKPDTVGDYADNKYKTNFAFDDETELAKFKARIEEIASGEKFKVKQPKLPFKELKDGTEVGVTKTGYKPLVVDAKKQPIPEDTTIGGGSRGRLVLEVFNYDKGLSLRLKKVQLLEVQGGNTSADEFDVEDGFVAQAREADDEVSGADDDLDI